MCWESSRVCTDYVWESSAAFTTSSLATAHWYQKRHSIQYRIGWCWPSNHHRQPSAIYLFGDQSHLERWRKAKSQRSRIIGKIVCWKRTLERYANTCTYSFRKLSQWHATPSATSWSVPANRQFQLESSAVTSNRCSRNRLIRPQSPD